MALIWADFPSEQQGLYGTTRAYMLNGMWSAFEGTYNANFITLQSDPDPLIDTAGVVIRFNQNGANGAWGNVLARLTFPTAVDTAGYAARYWLNQYPVNDSFAGNPYWEFRNISNALIARVWVGASGQLLVYNAAGTLVYTSDPAAITANAYNHIETKVFRSNTVGTIEVRVNGIVKADVSGLNLGTTDIVNVALGQDNCDDAVANCTVYIKDMVFWDGTGSYVNDFVGAVSVYDIVPNGDDTLNWSLSSTAPATGWNLLDDYLPSNILTVSGAISDGNVVRIDNTYYRLSSGTLDSGSPAGTSGNPWRVLIGATNADTLSNLYKAIGATGVAGTDYSTALTAHTTVNADWVNDTMLGVEAKLATGVGITCTETGSFTAWAASTLTNGPVDNSYIYADNSLPPESIFTLTDLPEDVISVRAVMPIGRMLKSDGGDCTVQMGVSPNGTDWDDGEDRPITVAATYYRDVSYLSPDTGTAWTPSKVNDMVIRVDRTT